ncbi:sucrase ferredoxin [Rhodococcus sp. NPDC127528]|uniref:sucrase ferredoxin n=1 Tax=unclassified Rhodococcus (in: high G+C Gram-positive bacteria) TaxID=192944 RepID=UPI0036396E4E
MTDPIRTDERDRTEEPLGPWTCSARSAVDEPLPGTAAHVTGWLCLEHPGGWGRDVFSGEAFGPELSDALERRVDEAGLRLLLIRRPGRVAAVPPRRTVLLARSDPNGTWCERFEVSRPADLLDLDLALPAAAPGIGRPVTDPVTLVCAHGKRDQCCAVLGRPVAAELSDRFGDAVWECSHTGGHRFAPSVIVLPTGYTYGRLTAPQSVEAVLAAGRGEVYPAGLRGRSCWTPPGQVAEIAVRQRVPAAADDLAVDETGAAPVVRHRDGRAWAVEVSRVELEPRPASCGAVPKPAVALVAGAVTPR